MAIGRPIPDAASVFNSLYKITEDVSGWDKVTIQLIAPVSGAVLVYASNNGGAGETTQGNARLATDFSPVQVTNLATGTAVSSMSAAGLYRYDVNAQFMRLQGAPAAAGTNVYKLFQFNSKVG